MHSNRAYSFRAFGFVCHKGYACGNKKANYKWFSVYLLALSIGKQIGEQTGEADYKNQAEQDNQAAAQNVDFVS